MGGAVVGNNPGMVMRVGVGVLSLALAAGVWAAPLSAATPAGEKADKKAAAQLAEFGCFIGAKAPSGQRLKAATIRFQAANGLKQSGDLGTKTLRNLGKATAGPCDDRPVPKHTGKGRRIVMSQGQNWLWLVNSDGTVEHQGGVVDNDWLPQDRYRTGDQCGRPGRARYRSDLATQNLSIDYFVRFAKCTVGFHQIPVTRSTGRQIHPDYLAGTDLAISHGCIRLPRPTIVELWKFTKKPTEVVITK